ncbi:hypothetical protein [Burkholderia cenocepacia]|uniref:hypothetical protein n=1 Tax=Burkholderia cenocepacia TaxID=95486 RepID=UPI000F568750|nr:hypothetical protein [Burkholderia cenocepacia]
MATNRKPGNSAVTIDYPDGMSEDEWTDAVVGTQARSTNRKIKPNPKRVKSADVVSRTPKDNATARIKPDQARVKVPNAPPSTNPNMVSSIVDSLDEWASDGAPQNPTNANFQIEKEIHKQLKAYAVAHETTVSRLLRALIARELASKES